jgi:hypothetical protein
MSTCFVIQPFSDPYNQRYKDTYEPAIKAAGCDPYRVDKDKSSIIPIETIERKITEADICFADISEDNPNVWFELGYAIAAGKDICIVCDEVKRNRLPFDVQHRRVIFYKTHNPSDFRNLEKEIEESLSTRIQVISTTNAFTPALLRDGDEISVSDLELQILAILAGEQGVSANWVSAWTATNRAERIGYTAVASALGLRKLERSNRIETSEETDSNYEKYPVVRLSDAGWAALETEMDRLNLRHNEINKAEPKTAVYSFPKDWNDEVPF